MFDIDVSSGLIISCLKIFLTIFTCSLMLIAFFTAGHLAVYTFSKKIALNKITLLILKISFGSIFFSIFYTACGAVGLDLTWVSLLSLPAILILGRTSLYNNFFIIKKLLTAYYKSPKSPLIKFIQILLIILFFRVFLPVVDSDTASYYIPAVQDILAKTKIGPYFYNNIFNLPQTYQILYSPFIVLNIYEATQLLNFAFLLLIIILLYQITKLLNLRKIFALALVMMLANPGFLDVNGKAEIYLSFLTTLNIVLLLNLLKKPNDDLLTAGMALTFFSFAIKPTTIIIAAIFAAAYLFIWFKKFNLKAPNLRQLFILQITLLPALFWYGKTLIFFDSTLYPYFQKEIYVTANDKKVPVYETSKTLLENCVSAKLKGDKNISKYVRDINNTQPSTDNFSTDNLKPDIYDFIFDQSVYVDKWTDKYFPLMLFCLLPFWIKQKRILVAGSISIALLAVFLANSNHIKYDLTIFPLLALLATFNITFILNKVYKKFAHKAMLMIVGICVYFITYTQISLIIESDPILQMRYLAGTISLRDYLTRTSDKSIPSTRVTGYLDTHYNNKFGVLMLGDANTLYLQRPFIADYEGTAKQMIPWLQLIAKHKDSHGKMRSELRKNNFRYILVNFNTLLLKINRDRILSNTNMRLNESDKPDPELIAKAAINLGAFLNIYTKQIYLDRSNKIGLYRILDMNQLHQSITVRKKNIKTCDVARSLSH